MKDPIIILGPGRCGSTLLQRILNTSADMTIWGEHGGFMKGLAQSYFMLTESELLKRNIYGRERITPSMVIGAFTDYGESINWVNSFNNEIVRERYTELIVKLLNNGLDVEKTSWGFKEILYNKNDRTMDMWLELFPKTKVVFSLRHPYDVIRSMIVSWENPKLLKEQLETNNLNEIKESSLRYAARWNNVVSSFQYWINEKEIIYKVEKYEDLMEKPKKSIKDIFQFIEIEMPATALEPMSVRVEASQKLDYEKEVRRIVYEMGQEIWQIVGSTAEYFGYEEKEI
ncbi:MAG: sulfotransferase [Gomphosphaeria aponina SAG 52.96 = DSM 107014]|uniref:Sulfotransferase n=1 Tax=Gomphosphaeria aponina SAG 52.96 = DSM 107014 TaxID=1521640 RepID=A0A941JSS9_9CHRO|nr:sulfotransferase [Gomphosphaeria aponina SAG 52.96 = DSM 107014]